MSLVSYMHTLRMHWQLTEHTHIATVFSPDGIAVIAVSNGFLDLRVHFTRLCGDMAGRLILDQVKE